MLDSKPKTKQKSARQSPSSAAASGTATLSGPLPSSDAPLSSFYSSCPIHALSAPVQAKFTIGKANDPYERQADSVADHVVSGRKAPAITPIPAAGLGSVATLELKEEEGNPQIPAQTKRLQALPGDDEDAETGSVQTTFVQQVPEVKEEAETTLQDAQLEEEKPEASAVKALSAPNAFTVQRLACSEECPYRELENTTEAQPLQRETEPEAEPQHDATRIQTKSGQAQGVATESVRRAIETPQGGEPLHDSIRSGIEPAIGRDLSKVRVHDNSSARSAAKTLNAKAFTLGKDIFLGPRGSQKDQRLMAHEVTHVIQQNRDVQGLPFIQRDESTSPVTTPGKADDMSAADHKANVNEASRSFARTVERKLGLEEGSVEHPDRSDIGLPPEKEAQERQASALSKIAASTEQLHAKTEATAEGQKVPEEKQEPTREPQDMAPQQVAPEAVAAEIEGARVPVEGVSPPVSEIAGPGPESESAMNRLRSAPDVDPTLAEFGEAINERITSLRDRVAGNATRASIGLKNEAVTQRAGIRNSMAASQAAVNDTMVNTRARFTESKTAAQDVLTQRGDDAHASNAEFSGTETSRLQENVDGSINEARSIFSSAGEEVSSTGDNEAKRGSDYSYNLAEQARQTAESEAAYYRRTEEDEDLGEDKANAVIEVADRFARKLEEDGDNLFSDVQDQTEEAREQITAEEEPIVSGLAEAAPGAIESVQTYLGSVDDAVDSVVQQGSDQLDAAETGGLREIDNLEQAAQGRGEALLAEGEAGVDAALVGGLLAQTSLAAQAGQLLDNASRDSIEQIAELGDTGRGHENPDNPEIIQREPETSDLEIASSDDANRAAQDAVLGHLDQVGPSLDQASDSQTTDLQQPLQEAASGADQAYNFWVNETQGNMDRLAETADSGFTDIADGGCNQIDNTLEQSQAQISSEVDQISEDISNNVEEIRSSVDGGVDEATASLRGGVEEGNAHADETLSELPAEMESAARSQESIWGKVGHWFSEQLAETWQAIKGMADWGFILDLVVGIVVGVLVAVAVAALIGTGVGALLVAGALAGAAGFAAAQMSANVRHGDPLFKDVGRAAILGAFVGFGAALAGPGVLGLGLLAGTGVVMLAAGVGTIVSNLATGREWDEQLLATVLIVGVFHAVMKPVMDRVPIRLPARRGPAPAEEPPGEVPPTPERPVPRLSETPPAGMSAELQAVRSSLTDPRAVEAFDTKFQNAGGDSAKMQRIIDDMRRGGNLEDLLIREWERTHPTPQAPRGDALDQVPGVRNRALRLRAEAEEFLAANPEIKSDLLRKTDAQIARLDEMLQGKIEATTDNVNMVRSALRGLEGELRSARGAGGVTGTGREFTYSGGRVEIDTVADQGRTWIDSKSREPFGLESNQWPSYEAQARAQLQAARENPVEGRPPSIIWDWPNGVGADVASALTRMGITVRGQRVQVPLPAIPPVPTPERKQPEEE